MALTVETSRGPGMDVQPSDVAGRDAAFHVTFLNHAPVAVRVWLRVADNADGLRFHIAPDGPVIVPAGGTAGPVTVHAVPRVRTIRTIRGKPHPYQLEFIGLVVENNGAFDLDRSPLGWARFTYVPPLTWLWLPRRLCRASAWVLMLLSALLFLLLAGRTLASEHRQPVVPAKPAPTPVVSSARRSLLNLLLEPPFLRFGRHDGAQTVHVVNLGPAPLTVAAVTIAGTERGDFVQHNTCAGRTLRAYSGCIIRVRFTPGARGPRHASLAISGATAPGTATTVLMTTP